MEDIINGLLPTAWMLDDLLAEYEPEDEVVSGVPVADLRKLRDALHVALNMLQRGEEETRNPRSRG